MASFADRITAFYASLEDSFSIPANIEIMNPYKVASTLEITRIFYEKFFNDNEKRYFIFGINPGRHGGGVTGIPFTDPIRLINDCSIPHSLPLKPELSSQFIYMMINAFGGAEIFYKRFFLTAVCPLGFTMNGKNANYYDSAALLKSTWPFIVDTLRQQVKAGAHTERCYCLGQGKNFEQLSSMNKELKLFRDIVVLPHPRWILQYKRKSLQLFINEYVKVLGQA